MKLIDVRETSYGKVADVQLDNAMLSFSIPYDDFCELQRQGRLEEEDLIVESNVRFMSQVHTDAAPKVARFMDALNWRIEAEARAAEIRDDEATRASIIEGVSSPAWWNSINPLPY